jgi:predicted metal-dependent phosphoesterase TrpH
LKIDFHCHTYSSSDSVARIPQLLKTAHQHGLGRLVITDHNSIGGALAAHRLEPDFVIVGEEIQTTYGEILAAFVSTEIPKRLDPFKVIELLRQQGAFISVSHPFDPYRSGWPLPLLEEIAPLVDAVEIANARVLRASWNAQALAFAERFGLPGTAGSDAHDPHEVGCMALDFSGAIDTAAELKAAIPTAQVVGRVSPFWVHGYSTLAKFEKKLGWFTPDSI